MIGLEDADVRAVVGLMVDVLNSQALEAPTDEQVRAIQMSPGIVTRCSSRQSRIMSGSSARSMLSTAASSSGSESMESDIDEARD